MKDNYIELVNYYTQDVDYCEKIFDYNSLKTKDVGFVYEFEKDNEDFPVQLTKQIMKIISKDSVEIVVIVFSYFYDFEDEQYFLFKKSLYKLRENSMQKILIESENYLFENSYTKA